METSVWDRVFLYKPYLLRWLTPHTRRTQGQIWSALRQMVHHLRTVVGWTPETVSPRLLAEVVGRGFLGPPLSRSLPLRSGSPREVVALSQLLDEVEPLIEPFFTENPRLRGRGSDNLEKHLSSANTNPTPDRNQPKTPATRISNRPKKRYETPPIPKAGRTMGQRPPISLRAKKTAEQAEVPMTGIVGVAQNPHWVDKEFHPKTTILNKRFRKVWRWVHNQPPTKVDYGVDTIVLAQVEEGRYYVVEGLRRVVALKHACPDKIIQARVLDYRQEYEKSQARQVGENPRTSLHKSSRAMFRPSPIMRQHEKVSR